MSRADTAEVLRLKLCALGLAGATLLAGCSEETPDPIVAMPSSSAPAEPLGDYPALDIGKYPYNTIQLANVGQLPGNLPDAKSVMEATRLKGIAALGRPRQSAQADYHEVRWTYEVREGASAFIPQVVLLSGSWDTARAALVATWGEPYRQGPKSVQFVKAGAGALVVYSDKGMGVAGACLVPSWGAQTPSVAPSANASAAVSSSAPVDTAEASPSPSPSSSIAGAAPVEPVPLLGPEKSALVCAQKLAEVLESRFDPSGSGPSTGADKTPGKKGSDPKAPRSQQ